jgi:hypothetical protein
MGSTSLDALENSRNTLDDTRHTMDDSRHTLDDSNHDDAENPMTLEKLAEKRRQRRLARGSSREQMRTTLENQRSSPDASDLNETSFVDTLDDSCRTLDDRTHDETRRHGLEPPRPESDVHLRLSPTKIPRESRKIGVTEDASSTASDGMPAGEQPPPQSRNRLKRIVQGLSRGKAQNKKKNAIVQVQEDEAPQMFQDTAASQQYNDLSFDTLDDSRCDGSTWTW